MNEVATSVPNPPNPPDPRVLALVAPISDAQPQGVDLSYDPEFERLVAELEKLTSMSGETPDWHFVMSECERTLREKSKDLRVMGWLVAAQAFTGGWNGVASGLDAYASLTRSYWPSLYPPPNRLRARAGQVEWLWGVLARRIGSFPVDSSDLFMAQSLEPRIAELGAFFAEHLKEADPGIGSMKAALREKLKVLIAAAPPPPPPLPVPSARGPLPVPSVPPSPSGTRIAAAPAAPPPAIAVAAVDASSLAGLDETQDAARPLRDPLMTLAHHARRVAPTSIWPYRVLRFAAWLTVERAPEAEGNRTPLRAPKASDAVLLTTMQANAQWDALLETAEDLASSNILWLDPHRMAAIALDNKGPEFRAARHAVGREAAAFVDRVPGLTSLQYSNGTPFASPETIEWLAAEHARYTKGGAGAAPAKGSASDSGEDAPILAALEERIAAGSPDDALSETLSDAAQLTSARSRFRVHLAVARQAQIADRLDVSHALYERLVAQVDTTLEQWEPGLAAEALAGFLKVLRQLGRNRRPDAADPAPHDDLETALFRRLLALDPHAALRSRA